MTKKTDTPAIRFKGFSDTWEQRKLGDVVQITMGQSPDGSTYSDEPSDYILVQGNADLQNGWVCPRIWTTQITKKADAGDLIMSVRAPAGAMGKTAYNAVIGRGVAAIKGNEFIYQLLVKMDADGFWKTLSCGSTFESLNSDNINNAEVKIPTTAEQIKIGGYFQQLDNLITLHQRQSFSHSTPDISLSVQLIHPFYTSSWEQRKLGEVIRLNGRIGFRGYTEKDIVSKDDGGVLTFSPTNIVDNKLTTNCKNTYITRFKYDESPEIKIHNGDILFVKTGSTLGKSALVTGLSEDATLNPQVVVMRTNNLNVEFLAAMLVTNAIISQVNSAKIGGAVPTLTETRIKDFDVAIPVSEAEKEQIGQFFSQLDNLITLHQRKGKTAVSGCSNDANNSKGVCCKARNFGYKCHKKDESK